MRIRMNLCNALPQLFCIQPTFKGGSCYEPESWDVLSPPGGPVLPSEPDSDSGKVRGG